MGGDGDGGDGSTTFRYFIRHMTIVTCHITTMHISCDPPLSSRTSHKVEDLRLQHRWTDESQE